MQQPINDAREIMDSVTDALPYIRALTRKSPNAVEEANDLFQDTFITLLARRLAKGTLANAKYARLTARSQFYSAKRHEVAQSARARRRARATDDGATRQNGQTLPKIANQLLDLLIAEADNRRLANALAAVSSADREILTLRFLHGKQRRELALALGLSSSGASSRLQRAKQRLRHAMESQRE